MSEHQAVQYVEFAHAKWPMLGFGTWQLTGDACADAVEHALWLGYRHIDTAQAYENEEQVGRGIKRSEVPRSSIWITTKVAPSSLRAPDVHASVQQSLRRLGTDYVDLLLVHWPSPDVPLEETLGAFEALRKAGKTRFVGVSNFTIDLQSRARDLAPIICNQVEMHPFLAQKKLRAAAAKRSIHITAYSPLARGEVAHDPTLVAIGEAHGKTPGQVALRWLIQHDVITIPKAAKKQHRVQNYDIFDFELPSEDMERIDTLDSGRRLVDPSWAPQWDQD